MNASPAKRLPPCVWLVLILIVGTAVSGLMISRSQVDGDHLDMLARGWLLASKGEWVSIGMRTSAGGFAPGPLTSALVALPLLVWRDSRAPTVVVLLFHLSAFLLLDTMMRRFATSRERLLFAVFFWLNPWRLFFSGFLWDPNYLFLFGALHTTTSYAQRVRGSFWASAAHVAALGFAMELHTSAVLLVIASVLLYWRGYLKLHWRGALVGAGLVVMTLVPWVGRAFADPSILPAHRGFPGRGLLLLFPVLRGIGYWLRYASLSLAGRMVHFDFTPAFGPAVDRLLMWVRYVLMLFVGPLTLVVAILANWHLWRRGRARLALRPESGTPPRLWLRGYVMWTLVAAVAAFCLSPTTIMVWQVLIVLHVAVLPLVFWAAALSRTRHRRLVRRSVGLAALASVALGLAMAVAAPMYRCGGRDGIRIAMLTDYPMLAELHIPKNCSISFDPVNGWWFDVLPRPWGEPSPSHPTRRAPQGWERRPRGAHKPLLPW